MERFYCSRKLDNCQVSSVREEVTFTTTTKEVESKFAPKKSQSDLLAASYHRLKLYGKSNNVSECGSFLQFIVASDESSKLAAANFCKDRLCPMCAWRRALKIYGNVSAIMDNLGDKYRYVFLTLTVPNCSGHDLSETIDKMQKAWTRFTHRVKVKRVMLGYFRALEITRNSKDGSYHPHFHCVIAVSPAYFSGREYLKQSIWLQLWRDSMQDQSITQVDVRTMKDKITGASDNLSSAVAESAKYAVKSADYIFKGNEALTDTIVRVLSEVLSKRHLIQLGGVFLDSKKSLSLDDEEDGDLIHINETFRDDVATMILTYKWSAGVYKLVKTEEYHINLEE